MAITLNLNPGGRFSVPGGYPFSLSVPTDTFAAGVIPKGSVSVSATVIAALGVTPTGVAGSPPTTNAGLGAPNVYLALFATPASSGAADGAEVSGTRVTIAGLANAPQTMTCSVPASSSTAPATYIVRLWCDGLTGTNAVQVNDMTVA